MNIGRFFSWSVLAGMAIAGGLFVSDQHVVEPSALKGTPIPTGEPLRLGVILSDVPGTTGLNQAISHTLLLARNQVNQCGGINQAPVFLAMDNFTQEQNGHPNDLTVVPQKQSVNSTDAIAQETQSMHRLIQTQDIHGAIAAFTPEPNSYGLTSEALDTAIDFKIPTISPANTQPLLVSPDNSRLDRFRLELSRMEPSNLDSRHLGNSVTKSQTSNTQIRTKRTKYWSRTMMSDRQYLMMVAQLAHQEGWNRIVTVGPDSDRTAYLEKLLAETVDAWSGTLISAEQFLRYQVTSSDSPQSIPELSDPTLSVSEDSPPSSAFPPSDVPSPASSTPAFSSIDISFATEVLVAQPPDAIILFLEPGMFADLALPSFPQASPQATPLDGAPHPPSLPITEQTSSNSHPTYQDTPVLKTTLPPILGAVPQSTIVNENSPLPHVGSALMNQLRAVVNVEQTPVILGNWLDVQILLEQLEQMPDLADTQGAIAGDRPTNSPQPPSSEPPSHPLTGLRGILPLPAQSPHHFFRKTQTAKPPRSKTVPNSAIAPATWDAAILMMLAAEVAGYNHKDAIQENLHNVANPPGTEVTDVCEALDLIRQGQSINYQGISGRVDLDGWGNVNPPQTYKLWEITSKGIQKTVDHLEWAEPSSSPLLFKRP